MIVITAEARARLRVLVVELRNADRPEGNDVRMLLDRIDELERAATTIVGLGEQVVKVAKRMLGRAG